MKTTTKSKVIGKKIDKIVWLILPSFIILTLVFLFKPMQAQKNSEDNLPLFDLLTLRQYNGTDPDKPVYIAYEGLIYDVSPGRREFYDPGKTYHHLAGKDSTTDLNIAGGSIIKKKYKVVGRFSN